MEYLVKRYENYGKGFEKVVELNYSDKIAKDLTKDLEYLGYKRVKGNGIIGLTYEGITEDKMGKVQITIERVVD